MTYASMVGGSTFLTALETSGYEKVENLPFDKVFRGAWKILDGSVVEDLARSKLIAHELRRIHRDRLYAPHDAVVTKRIPGQPTIDAEAAREVIRIKDAELQELIDSKLKLNTLKEVLLDHDLILGSQLGERSLENGY